MRLFKVMIAGIGFMAWSSANLHAQTAVTTSGGAANTLPLFTGTATVGNSAVVQSGTKIGIGTTAPGGLLTLSAPRADGAATPADGLLFQDYSAGTAQWAQAAIFALSSTGYNGNLIFETDGDGLLDSALTEKMRITYNGLVGIGTIAPTAKLGKWWRKADER